MRVKWNTFLYRLNNSRLVYILWNRPKLGIRLKLTRMKNNTAWRWKMWVQKVFKRWGFMPIKDHRDRVARLNDERKKLEEVNWAGLAGLIGQVRMTKVQFEGPRAVAYMNDEGQPDVSPYVRYEDAPPGRWYQVKLAVDAAAMHRIYSDLGYHGDSPEMEHFIRSVMWKLESELKVLMKVGV